MVLDGLMVLVFLPCGSSGACVSLCSGTSCLDDSELREFRVKYFQAHARCKKFKVCGIEVENLELGDVGLVERSASVACRTIDRYRIVRATSSCRSLPR